MDELLHQVLSESERLSELGKKAGYESFVRLIELREQLVEKLNNHEPSNVQRERLRQLKSYETILLQHMQELKAEAEAGLQSIMYSRIQRRGYYQEQAPVGGWLFDRKS